MRLHPGDGQAQTGAREIDNLRAALDWAFSPKGDLETGIALTIGVVPLWVRQSLLAECRGRVEQALATLGAKSPKSLGSACSFPLPLAGR